MMNLNLSFWPRIFGMMSLRVASLYYEYVYNINLLLANLSFSNSSHQKYIAFHTLLGLVVLNLHLLKYNF